MVLALRRPELVERLCVVDIAPVDYGGTTEFDGYVKAMRGLDLALDPAACRRRRALAEAVPDQTVRDFLLQNLRRDGEGLALAGQPRGPRRRADEISGWPEGRLEGAPYEGPVLWVAGRSRATSGPGDEARCGAGSPTTAGSWSRVPATGCTPSSPRSSSRCCGASRIVALILLPRRTNRAGSRADYPEVGRGA